jgi:hypothetical protein
MQQRRQLPRIGAGCRLRRIGKPEGQRAELGAEDIVAIQGIGDIGETSGLRRHVDGMAVAGAQGFIEVRLWPR